MKQHNRWDKGGILIILLLEAISNVELEVALDFTFVLLI